MSELANINCTLEIVPQNPADDTTGVIAPIFVQGKFSADGGKIIVDGSQVAITVITVPAVSATIPDPGPITGTFEVTIEKVKSDGKIVLQLDDETEVLNATPKIPASPNPIDYPTAFTVKITDAGQNVVRGK